MPAATSSIRPVSGLDEIVATGSKPEQILTGFEFVEGPAWDPRDQSLIFSDIIGDTLYRWSEASGQTIVRRPSHMANGNTWDRDGQLLSCEHATSRVSRTNSDGTYEVIASHFQDHELNSPNDIVVRSDGLVYFTDPNSGRTRKYGIERSQELEFQGVFCLDPETSELTLLSSEFEKPNGLCFSLDESLLYINDTSKQHIRVFDALDEGRITNGRLFASTDGDMPGVADGMKIDSTGTLYCCGSGGIHVFKPDGTPIGLIKTPEVAANFTWGGPQLTDMYITATHSIYWLGMKTPGIRTFAPKSAGSQSAE